LATLGGFEMLVRFIEGFFLMRPQVFLWGARRFAVDALVQFLPINGRFL
jgi:hypothetical protein